MTLLRAIFRRFGYAIIPLDEKPEFIILTIPKGWSGTFTVVLARVLEGAGPDRQGWRLKVSDHFPDVGKMV